MKKIISATLFIFVFGCGTGDEQVSDSESVHDSLNAVSLQVTSEIGVELGDSNFVFGVIQDVDFTSDGNIAVLDAQKNNLRLYSPSGEFLGQCGGAGEAPGEFLSPRAVACLNDGRIAITDPFSREVELFTEDLQPSETYTNFTGRAPFVITAALNGFAGEQGGFNRDEGIITTSVLLWHLDSDSIQLFSSVEDPFSPEDMLQRRMQPSAGFTADNSNIYYSTPNSEEYSIQVFPIDGTDAYQLNFPGYSSVDKTEEDKLADIEDYENMMQAMANAGRGGRLAGTEYEPLAQYYATGSIGIDAQGNIWVQRGWESNPTFDLFPSGSSVPGETVVVDPELNLSGYSFVVSPFGIAAFDPNPEYYPKVLVLDFSV